MINILVTGSNGQLGKCIKDLEQANSNSNFNFIYTDHDELDISKLKDVLVLFENKKFDYCINCAAYTSVDAAENDREVVYKVNTLGTQNLASACEIHNTILLHISTDFVFEGIKNVAYTEIDDTNPINEYGNSKLKSELAIKKCFETHFIIRTSWLYSKYGKNFMKTMIELSKSRDEIKVVNDQFGTPTYAPDLAKILWKLIASKNENFGIYHYSNEGQTNWYEFAKAIFEETNTQIKLIPIKSDTYSTLARRPQYSILDKSKIKRNLRVEIPHWRDSLKKAIIEYYE